MVHVAASDVDQSGDENSAQPSRRVTRITVIQLRRGINLFETAKDAAGFLDGPAMAEESKDLERYEVRIEFSNGERIEANYTSKARVKAFIEFFAN